MQEEDTTIQEENLGTVADDLATTDLSKEVLDILPAEEVVEEEGKE